MKPARTTLALTMRDVTQEVKASKFSENRRYNPDVIPDMSVARGGMQGGRSRGTNYESRANNSSAENLRCSI